MLDIREIVHGRNVLFIRSIVLSHTSVERSALFLQEMTLDDKAADRISRLVRDLNAY